MRVYPVPKRGAFTGVSDHYGWAVLVTVQGDGSLLDRRRIRLVDEEMPKYPYHHEAQTLPLEEALDLIERVRGSALHFARLGLDALARELSAGIHGVALRECPALPPTVSERIRNYRAQNVADSVMYRQALAEAAVARGWGVHWYSPKTVIEEAGGLLRVKSMDDYFLRMRKSLGPPWGRDHKLAMAAAIVAMKTSK